MCEVRSDKVDRNLKYGGGPEDQRELLENLSKLVYRAAREPRLRLKATVHRVLKTFLEP